LTDRASYSDDGIYRWWFERRWGDGPLLCWVGLNPGTGDTDGRPRRTLGRVEALARSLRLDGVLVVNLFAYRTTDPAALRGASVDIIGSGNDDVIQWATDGAAVTLAGWGAQGRLHGRGRHVAGMLIAPVCLGVTKRGEPLHPLFVPRDTRLVPLPPAP
jgi:hypothetical protein